MSCSLYTNLSYTEFMYTMILFLRYVISYRHTAAIAAGNHGIEVVVAGHQFGNASGMAPRSQ